MANSPISLQERAESGARRRAAVTRFLVTQSITTLNEIDLTHPVFNGLDVADLSICLRDACAKQASRSEPAVRRMLRNEREWVLSAPTAWRPMSEMAQLPPILSNVIYNAVIGQWDNTVWQILFYRFNSNNGLTVALCIQAAADRDDPEMYFVDTRNARITAVWRARKPSDFGVTGRKTMTGALSGSIPSQYARAIINQNTYPDLSKPFETVPNGEPFTSIVHVINIL